MSICEYFAKHTVVMIIFLLQKNMEMMEPTVSNTDPGTKSPPVQESSPILVDVESDCKICKASFNSIKELRSHLRYEHYCDMCNFIAPRAFRLNGHKTQAHGVTHLQTS